MRMHKTLILLGVLAASPALSQVTLPIGLQQPIERALQRDKAIANKEIDLEKAGLDRKAVLGKYIPHVDAMAGYAYFDNQLALDLPGYRLPLTGLEVFPDRSTAHNNGNLAHAGLMAKSVLFSGMQIRNGAEALRQKAEGDALMIQADRDAVVVDVVTSFDKLRYIRASQELVDDSDRRLQKEEERVARAIANGLAVPFDRDKLKLARLELEMKRTQLEESHALLLQKIGHLTGMAPSEAEAVAYELGPIEVPAGLTADGRSELQALEHYKQASESMVRKEKGSFLPMVGVFGGVSYTSLFNGRSEFDIPVVGSMVARPEVQLNELTLAPNWMMGVGLSWQILGGNGRTNELKKAKLGAAQLENKLEDSREKLGLLLSSKQAAQATQLKQLALAEQQEVVAGNNLTLARQQYAEGLLSVTDRVAAENDFLKAAQGRVEALAAQRQAALETWQAAGQLTQKIIYQ